MSVAEKYQIIPHCRFNKVCSDLTWDSSRSVWICTFQDTVSGEIFRRETPVVISAIGTLDRPFIPEVEGAQSFKGKMFHSARWDDSLKPRGKNIVVLGNGASATQFVPEMVKDVGTQGSVTQFVRSAHWWTKRVYSHLWCPSTLYNANVRHSGKPQVLRDLQGGHEIRPLRRSHLPHMSGMAAGKCLLFVLHDLQWCSHAPENPRHHTGLH